MFTRYSKCKHLSTFGQLTVKDLNYESVLRQASKQTLHPLHWKKQLRPQILEMVISFHSPGLLAFVFRRTPTEIRDLI